MEWPYKIACALFHPFRIHISSWRPSRDEYFRVSSLIRELGAKSVLDVGANTGQFAKGILKFATGCTVYSFEPQTKIHAKLTANARGNEHWHVAPRCALGDQVDELELNISRNTYSSSFLEVKPIGVQAAPASAYVGREKASIIRLDDWVKDASIPGPMFLKIDTQGYELKVLRGASGILPQIRGILVECSLSPQYDGQPLMYEVMQFLHAGGFQVVDILPGLRDPTSGRFLGLDLLSRRLE